MCRSADLVIISRGKERTVSTGASEQITVGSDASLKFYREEGGLMAVHVCPALGPNLLC